MTNSTQVVTTTLADRVPAADQVTHFLVKAMLSEVDGGPSEDELFEAIGEIELETQIAGASFIKVDLNDPNWAILTSGLFDVEGGLLRDIEVEFPEGSGWGWRLVAIEVTTDPTQPQVITFEDVIINDLREDFGSKSASTTSPEWVKALVDEVSLEHGHKRIRFVCPAIGEPK